MRYLAAIFLLVDYFQCESWKGNIIQSINQYDYKSYYSLDKDSCIVANKESGSKPTIQFCNGDYKIDNQNVVIPRNVFPICGYFPEWYDLTAVFFRDYIKAGFSNGNSTYEESMENCTKEIQNVGKSRYREMYNVNATELMCMRVSEFNVVHYGKDPEVVKLTKKIEGLIQDNVKWNNVELQASLIMSSFCFATNKQSCIASVSHLLEERNNSALNLLGYNMKTTPTTWLHADGLDIVFLHIITEIMGMSLELEVIRGVNYYTISPNASSGDFKELHAGLVGGRP
ncbi:hypothetical protein CONCODRAFT_80898 [Conidiobolus coronatus NRRL 28638]|uniref:Uncharacterized protein n=1 Tax=Conidiobolus coronatus (strain ATCC 28846 / CBS 209.66 / NRRL 28638) TaxID=796925 RepID=A0A137NQB4_CONC2|nr:hypothetical protein CONCODRAFT_80898 [Conidiobolus coronatus NRRL 28638]|eukprot:KXN64908.1 hypothetical protein CONCODRAFT_80898 [Conidiobolus coronatus NRRL 28638]